MKHHFWIAVFLLFSASCLSCQGCATHEEIVMEKKTITNTAETGRTPQQGDRRYAIKKFVDGDTFWIDDGTDEGIKIRLIGMDTPEARNTGRKKKHPMGKMVSDYVEHLLTGTNVKIELDVQERDQYRRVLAYVWMENGEMLNEHLLKMGYAQLLTVPPNIRYVDRFQAAQEMARESGRGLWGE